MTKEEGFALLKELAEIGADLVDKRGPIVLSYEQSTSGIPECVEVRDGSDEHEDLICTIYEYDEVELRVSECGKHIILTRSKSYEDSVDMGGKGEPPCPLTASFVWSWRAYTIQDVTNCKFMQKLKDMESPRTPHEGEIPLRFLCPRCHGENLVKAERCTQYLSLSDITATSTEENDPEISAEEVEVMEEVGEARYQCNDCTASWTDMNELYREGGLLTNDE